MNLIQRIITIVFTLVSVLLVSYLITDSYKEMMKAFGFISIFIIGTLSLLIGLFFLIRNKYIYIDKIGRIPNAIVFALYLALLTYIALLLQMSIVTLSLFILFIFTIWVAK